MLITYIHFAKVNTFAYNPVKRIRADKNHRFTRFNGKQAEKARKLLTFLRSKAWRVIGVD